MIYVGKVTTSLLPRPQYGGREILNTWINHSYGKHQLKTATDAFDRLLEVIETKMANVGHGRGKRRRIFTDAQLRRTGLPDHCFARGFMSHMKAPPEVLSIAPGIMLPWKIPNFGHYQQRFISVQHGSMRQLLVDKGRKSIIPPVLLFPTTMLVKLKLAQSPNDPHSVNGMRLEATRSPFYEREFYGGRSLHPSEDILHTGVYLEPSEYGFDDNGAGFRLFLPFSLRDENEHVAQLTDGTYIAPGDYSSLYQHGARKYGGHCWIAQDLEKLLENWIEMVGKEYWKVDQKGVVNTINDFRNAFEPETAELYRIGPEKVMW